MTMIDPQTGTDVSQAANDDTIVPPAQPTDSSTQSPQTKKTIYIVVGVIVVGGAVFLYARMKSSSSGSTVSSSPLVLPASTQNSSGASYNSGVLSALQQLQQQINTMQSQPAPTSTPTSTTTPGTSPTPNPSTTSTPTSNTPASIPNLPPSLINKMQANGEHIVSVKWNPVYKAWDFLTNKGGIYNISPAGGQGQGFFGSIFSMPDNHANWYSSNGQQIRTAKTLKILPNGGYEIVDTSGEGYTFTPASGGQDWATGQKT